MASSTFSLPGRRVDGRRFIEVAYDLLIFRKFGDVLSMCAGFSDNLEVVFPQSLQGISGSLLGRESDPEEEEVTSGEYADRIWRRKFSESVCILAIQAYAETDQWDQVHPFLKQYYGSPANYPLTIIKLCILLSAKVHDFRSAESLAGDWLSNASNHSLQQYSSVLELLITHILLPQSKLEEAQTLIELNLALSPETKMNFLKYLEKVKVTLIARKEEKSKQELVKDSTGSVLTQVIQCYHQLITRLVPVTGLHYIRDIAFFGFFIYLIVIKTNLASSTSLSRAAVLWSGIVRIWRSLFAPFHLMPKT